MDMKEIRKTARERLKGWCRVCPICDGRACAGEMPGMGGAGTGAAFMDNVRAFAAWKLNIRTLHDASQPDTAADFFGQRLSLPVMGAPMAGASYNLGGAMDEAELAEALHSGCNEAGSLCWSGDGANPSLFGIGLEAVTRQGGRGVPTVKPRGATEIMTRIRQAEDVGCTAVAVDVDAAGFLAMNAQGQPVGPTNQETIETLVQSTSLPVILKGVMTPDEAELAAGLGVGGLVISNHGGRVLDGCMATMDVLPGIAEAVKGKTRIFIDGGVRSGADVLKALALGADAVLIGRPLIAAAAGGGAAGVAQYLRNMQSGLAAAMILTGVADPGAVPRQIVTRLQR